MCSIQRLTLRILFALLIHNETNFVDQWNDPQGIHGHRQRTALSGPFGRNKFPSTCDKQPRWQSVNVNQSNRQLGAEKANVVKRYATIQFVECVLSVYEKYIRVVRLKKCEHSMYSCFNT